MKTNYAFGTDYSCNYINDDGHIVRTLNICLPL